MSYYNHKRTKYIEKPVTDDEREIATLVDTIENAITSGNLKQLMSVISESAQIAAADGKGIFNKKEFEEYIIALMPQVKHFSCSDIYIRTDGENGDISCLAHTAFINGFSKTLSRYFKCRKDNGIWLLTEAGYA